jgi:hypothetical protein
MQELMVLMVLLVLLPLMRSAAAVPGMMLAQLLSAAWPDSGLAS